MSAITSSVFSFSHKMFAQIPYRVAVKSLNQLTRLTKRILLVGPQLAECGGTFLAEIAHIQDKVVRARPQLASATSKGAAAKSVTLNVIIADGRKSG